MIHKRWPCRRCGRWKAKDFMCVTCAGVPITLCLKCEAHDRLTQARYAEQRQTERDETT